MAKYLKHYYVDADAPSTYVTTSTEPKYKRHPIEHAGLDVKVWLSDSDGVDVMLAQVPDSTTITTVTVGSKKGVEEITETEFNTVWTPYNQAMGLYAEANTASMSGDTDTAATKNTAGDAKIAEATTAIRAL